MARGKATRGKGKRGGARKGKQRPRLPKPTDDPIGGLGSKKGTKLKDLL